MRQEQTHTGINPYQETFIPSYMIQQSVEMLDRIAKQEDITSIRIIRYSGLEAGIGIPNLMAPEGRFAGVSSLIESGLMLIASRVLLTRKPKGDSAPLSQIANQLATPNTNEALIHSKIGIIDLFAGAQAIRDSRRFHRWGSSCFILPVYSTIPGLVAFENMLPFILQYHTVSQTVLGIAISAGTSLVGLADAVRIGIKAVITLKETDLEKRVGEMGGFTSEARSLVKQEQKRRKTNP